MEYHADQIHAQEAIETFVKPIRRSTYYVARIAHILDIPYWRVKHIKLEDVRFSAESKRYNVYMDDVEDSYRSKLVASLSMSDAEPLLTYLSIARPVGMVKHLAILAVAMDALGIYYDPNEKKALGYVLG